MNFLLLTFFFLAPLALAQDAKSIVTSTGCKLIQEAKVARPTGNVVICPPAIVQSAALLYNGAVGITASKIGTNFGFSNAAAINVQVQVLLSSVTNLLVGSQAGISSTSQIYLSNDLQIKDLFKTVAKQFYLTDVLSATLSDTLRFLSIIDLCVAEKTRDVIQDVLLYSNLNKVAKFVSVVAWYAQGPWTYPFDPLQTSQLSFHVDINTVVSVETMFLQTTLNYYEDTQLGVKYVELPFGGTAASLIIILSNEIDGLDRIVQNIAQTDNPVFKKQTVRLCLPKFLIKARWDAKNLIQHITGDSSFGDIGADFSNIAGQKGDVQIDVMEQVGYIRINEAGILQPQISAGVTIPKPPQGTNVKDFIVDHPFVFNIVRSGVISVRGFVRDPTAPPDNVLC